MDNVYMLTDTDIQLRLAEKIRTLRLQQNYSQQELAERSGVSVSTIIRTENGETTSVITLVRLLRQLGKLEVLLPLLEDEPLSPTEYYRLKQAAEKPLRKRATKSTRVTKKEETTW
ncbi:MAG: helix-turn-helix domain-containing protein [Paludibacteraceae bacterium]